MIPKSRHCPRCTLSLPSYPEFALCVRCEGPTSPSSLEPDLDVAHARFRVHEQQRKERGDPNPDVEGQLEALRELGVLKSDA